MWALAAAGARVPSADAGFTLSLSLLPAVAQKGVLTADSQLTQETFWGLLYTFLSFVTDFCELKGVTVSCYNKYKVCVRLCVCV